MPLDLFAGISVRDYEAAKAWYVLRLGAEPTVLAADGMRKVVYRDPDGNEIGFGGTPT